MGKFPHGLKLNVNLNLMIAKKESLVPHKVATATISSFSNVILQQISTTRAHQPRPSSSSSPPPLWKGSGCLAACPACIDKLLFEAWLGEHMAGAPQHTVPPHPRAPRPILSALCSQYDWASCASHKMLFLLLFNDASLNRVHSAKYIKSTFNNNLIQKNTKYPLIIITSQTTK